MAQESSKFVDGEIVLYADTCAPTHEANARGELKLNGIGKGAYQFKKVPEQFLPGIVSMGCWDAEFDQSWKLEWHQNEGIEFTLLDQGQVFFAVDDDEFELKPTQLTVTRPWQRHTVGKPFVKASRLHWIILDVGVRQPHAEWVWPSWVMLSTKELEELTVLLRGNEKPVWNSVAGINDCFLKIMHVLDHFSLETSETKLKLLINEFLLEVLALFKSSTHPLNPGLNSATRTVELFLKNLPRHLDKDWTLESMARHCSMGRTLFAKQCAQLTNQSPIKYLLKCRIEKVETLLRETDTSITDIAFQCGFNTSQYLSSQYRKFRGKTPQEYRKTLKK